MAFALLIIIRGEVGLSVRIEKEVIAKGRDLYFTRFNSSHVLRDEEESLAGLAKLLLEIIVFGG